jgi:hypothetical protein
MNSNVHHALMTELLRTTTHYIALNYTVLHYIMLGRPVVRLSPHASAACTPDARKGPQAQGWAPDPA